MTISRFKTAAVAMAGIAIAGACVVNGQDKTVSQKIGDGLRKAEQGIERGAKKVEGGVREGWDHTKNAVSKMSVESRVYGRLHWDKDLNTAALELEMRDPATVVLKGSVPTEAAKAKAVLLARDTMGITSVVDQLGVSASASTTTIKTTTEVSPKK